MTATAHARKDPLPANAALVAALAGPAGAAQRRALAKAITLIESTRADHRARADELLDALLPRTGRSLRIGISGVPGVGKSTLIETLGRFLIDRGHRVAVLAVDPSSRVSGGSILGDKTRMERLATHAQAFVRPSPSGGTLGGVAEKTREAMLVCEAAGHDVVIVETVGVGQSEAAVAGMTDLFVLLQLPNAGDELQAIKKGVMELADLVVVNKTDLDDTAAGLAATQIAAALRMHGVHATRREGDSEGDSEGRSGDAGPGWQPRVLRMSALEGTGLDEFWQAACEFRDLRGASGALAARRRAQDEAWMWERIETGLKERFRTQPEVAALLPVIADDVRHGRVAASVAARRLLALFH